MEDVVHTHNGIYLATKINEIMLFEAAWMDLENIIMNELSQRKTNTMYITYM